MRAAHPGFGVSALTDGEDHSDMPTIRIATFNLENLYTRPVFWDGDTEKSGGHQVGNVYFEDPDEGRSARRIAEAAMSDDKCQLTARALLSTRADIIALQEIDNENALRTFRRSYLNKLDGPHLAQGMKAWLAKNPSATPDQVAAWRRGLLAQVTYEHMAVLEGNDGRGIDVGVLSKLRFDRVTSHREKTFAELGAWLPGMEAYREKREGQPVAFTPQDRVFKRDCLEVEFNIDGAPFTLFVCHLKSMSESREASRIMREAESTAIRRIVTNRFGGRSATANWAICGDFNDYAEIDGDARLVSLRTGEPSPPGIGPLLDEDFAHNVLSRLAPLERWTTYHAPDDAYTQLDYILVSPALAARNPAAKPDIVRIGQPWRATRYADWRLPRVGWDRPKASDHCPVAITLDLA
jgi:endonuclease/exonuclease/phosphatase family metal-dependent hydrolase